MRTTRTRRTVRTIHMDVVVDARGARRARCAMHRVSQTQPLTDRPRERRQTRREQYGSPGGSGGVRKPSKKSVAAEVAKEVNDTHFLGSARATTENVIHTFYCPKCGIGELGPLAPIKPRGSASLALRFKCKSCSEELELPTGATQKLFFDPAAGDAADDAEAPQRKRQRMTPTDTMLLVLSTLLNGGGYVEYVNQCAVLGIEPIHSDTFQAKIYLIARHAKWVAEESVKDMRYYVARYGDIDELILCSDTFWHHRGHHSPSGTGTITDEETGGVLAYEHTCKHTDKAHTADQAYQGSSGSMDAYQFKINLERIIDWMNDEVPQLVDEYAVDLSGDPKICGVVIDGGASTSYQMAALAEKAADIVEYDCGNHLARRTAGRRHTSSATTGTPGARAKRRRRRMTSSTRRAHGSTGVATPSRTRS
jgi:hypothetical protein